MTESNKTEAARVPTNRDRAFARQFALLGLYEIVPGFLFSLLAIYVVSKFDQEPSAAVTRTFDAVGESKI